MPYDLPIFSGTCKSYKYSPALCESDVGAPCAAGGCIVDTCASCMEAACAGSEPIWPEMATAWPWRAPLIVVGTWAIVLAIWATGVLPEIWWTLLGAWCNVVGLWCNVVGTCGIPPGICGTCGIWTSSWPAAAYWQGVNGRFVTECTMLPVCLRSRALRLLNHTWNGAHDTWRLHPRDGIDLTSRHVIYFDIRCTMHNASNIPAFIVPSSFYVCFLFPRVHTWNNQRYLDNTENLG